MAAGNGEHGPEPAGPVRIGRIEGSAVNFGAGGTANNTNVFHGAPRDAAQEELLRAVRELRADLARVRRTGPTEVLEAELVGAEDEYEASGEVTRGRLTRLRDALADSGPVLELLASGGALAAAVAQLLGG
ncbi:hypothetical protein [Streptomyces sp. NPDC086023]|uniref:hypothetical protein n=1 Tax=Streptomyces sp. NPDC086023 TaxID=3365746 RepID=UPI0037D851F0